jgi:hypothetical protein
LPRRSVEVPLREDELRTLAGDAPNDEIADEALACWIDGFADDEEVMWTILATTAAVRLPPKSDAALGRFVGRLNSSEHFALVDRVLFGEAADTVDPSVFRALQLSDLNAQQFADRLIQLYEGANHQGS